MGNLQDRHEAMIIKAETNAMKGVKGGDCNVTQCQEPNSANYFNKSTKKYYCQKCAIDINKVNRRDCMELYGVPDLCELEVDEPALPMVNLTKNQFKKQQAELHNIKYAAKQAHINKSKA